MTTVDDIEFIVPCGGKSTRNYPHSKGLPHKSFMPFGDGRLIDRILADIVHAGGRHITIVCSGSDVVERFREALAPDPDMVEKLRQKGRPEIADALEATFLPPDTDLKYVVQDKPIGTAHVLGLAHRLSPHRHAMLVFPDDVILSHDPQNTHFQRLIRAFLEDPRQVLLTGVEKEDVSNNAIIYKNRLIEKPKVAYNHVGGFSPIVIPRQTLDFIMGQVDTYERTGKLPDNFVMPEDKGIIVDIRGGGLRLFSKKQYDADSIVNVSFPIQVGDRSRYMKLMAKVVMSMRNQNSDSVYDSRLQFVNMQKEDTEDIVKYVFAQQRMIRKKERGL